MASMSEDRFEIRYGTTVIQLERFSIGGNIAYKAIFNSKRQLLVVTKATNFNLTHFWTSIPEGRQQEAEGLGKLIEAYFLNNETN